MANALTAWWSRVTTPRTKGGGSFSILTGGSLPHSYPWNWWQMNLPRLSAADARTVPIVYACVMANARAVALCPPMHERVLPAGGFERITEGWLARLLLDPNGYETWPQFILNAVAEMLLQGEALALIERDGRQIPQALHRIAAGSWSVFVEPQTGAIFYGISRSGNALMPQSLDYMVPARDCMHFRAYTPRHPLMGESPLTAAALAVGVNVALSRSQAAFFEQMRRPSGILSTEEKLTGAQMKELRTAFDEQAAKWDQGGLPILSWGLKFQPLAVTSQDAQLIDAQRMSIEDVCRVYGVPPPIVADLSKATLTNAAELARIWLALGLGSLLESLERTIAKALGLNANNVIEFDTQALLRSDFVSRMDGLSKAVAGGVYSPNEARAQEGLPPIEGGNMCFLQQQMTPVNLLAEIAAKNAAAPTPAPAPAPAPEPAKTRAELAARLHAVAFA